MKILSVFSAFSALLSCIGVVNAQSNPPPTDPATCAFTSPTIADEYTVTLELFSDSGCCSSFETTKLGVLNTCHNANQPFEAFTQAVGQHMFSQGIHIEAYSSTDCDGTVSISFSLTNNHTCFVGGNQWQSFRIIKSPSGSDVIYPSSTSSDTSTTSTSTPTPSAPAAATTTSSNNTTSPSGSSLSGAGSPVSGAGSSLSGGAIGGIVVGAAAVVAIVGALFFFIGRRNRQNAIAYNAQNEYNPQGPYSARDTISSGTYMQSPSIGRSEKAQTVLRGAPVRPAPGSRVFELVGDTNTAELPHSPMSELDDLRPRTAAHSVI